jgi:hypothetical protein
MKIMLVIAAVVAAHSLAAQQVPADPRVSLFVRRGCADCHGIVALNIKAGTDAGPDLTFAYADVPYRYGMTLERFFAEPPGIMRLVLGVHIQLQPAQRDSLVRLFRDLYAEHLARLDSLQRVPRPVGTGSRPPAPKAMMVAEPRRD